MSVVSSSSSVLPSVSSVGEELVELGWEISRNQRRLLGLAARFDESLEWERSGAATASAWIAGRLGVLSGTAREWIRVGYALRDLPSIDAAWAAGELSFAKVRILTRWAGPGTEVELVELGRERSADRLTVAIARLLAGNGESDEERDARLHEARSFSSWTDGDGMTVIRVVVPPSVAKPVVVAVDELVRRIAVTPREEDLSADRPDQLDGCGPSDETRDQPTEAEVCTDGHEDLSADSSIWVAGTQASATETGRGELQGLADRLLELRSRWQPTDPDDDWVIPSLAQQRADAFVVLFTSLGIDLTTEVVIHVRGDGTTFDDGTPITNHAVVRQLDHTFIRLLLHDTQRRPINASSRRRHPTTRQKRVVLETHRGECVDCQSAELLEYDHNPPFETTGHTVTHELEPRCAPCHRARHRTDPRGATSSGAGHRVRGGKSPSKRPN